MGNELCRIDMYKCFGEHQDHTTFYSAVSASLYFRVKGVVFE